MSVLVNQEKANQRMVPTCRLVSFQIEALLTEKKVVTYKPTKTYALSRKLRMRTVAGGLSVTFSCLAKQNRRIKLRKPGG